MNKLIQIRRYLGVTQSQFAEILHVKQNTISSLENDKISLSPRNKQLLIERLGVSPEWLNGESTEMFTRGQPTSMASPATEEVLKKAGKGGLTIPSTCEAHHGKPYYSKPVTGSMNEAYDDMDKLEPEYYIDIPVFNKCAFYRPVYGESMAPKYNPGDIVACERVFDKRVILYGETYLCMIKSDADYYETIKTLRKNNNPALVTLKPINPDFDETTIPLDNVLQLYIIKGKIERNF